MSRTEHKRESLQWYFLLCRLSESGVLSIVFTIFFLPSICLGLVCLFVLNPISRHSNLWQEVSQNYIPCKETIPSTSFEPIICQFLLIPPYMPLCGGGQWTILPYLPFLWHPIHQYTFSIPSIISSPAWTLLFQSVVPWTEALPYYILAAHVWTFSMYAISFMRWDVPEKHTALKNYKVT